MVVCDREKINRKLLWYSLQFANKQSRKKNGEWKEKDEEQQHSSRNRIHAVKKFLRSPAFKWHCVCNELQINVHRNSTHSLVLSIAQRVTLFATNYFLSFRFFYFSHRAFLSLTLSIVFVSFALSLIFALLHFYCCNCIMVYFFYSVLANWTDRYKTLSFRIVRSTCARCNEFNKINILFSISVVRLW